MENTRDIVGDFKIPIQERQQAYIPVSAFEIDETVQAKMKKRIAHKSLEAKKNLKIASKMRSLLRKTISYNISTCDSDQDRKLWNVTSVAS